jgi:hypothetical protein
MSMKKGTKLTDEERERLARRITAQRCNAEEMLERLRAQREREVDFTADTRSIQMVAIPENQREELAEVDEIRRLESQAPAVALVPAQDGAEWPAMTGGPVALNSHAHGQLANYTGIPKTYYDRMLAEDPALLSFNVNTWFQANHSERMIRAYDARQTGEGIELALGRAFLSNRYRRLDSLELAESFVPMLADPASGWTIHQCGLTDLRMHIEAVFPNLTTDINPAVGDEVALAVKIQTSDVGAGAVSVQLGVHRLVCTNLMVVPSYSKRQVHIGGATGAIAEVLSDRTLRMEDRLTIRKLRELVAGMADAEAFRKIAGTLRATTEVQLEEPIAAAQLLARSTGLTETELGKVQNELARAGDPTLWGLTNALTATARELDYERKAELETAAGKLVEDRAAWKALASARAA